MYSDVSSHRPLPSPTTNECPVLGHVVLTTNRLRGDEIVRYDVEGPHTLVQSVYLLLYRLQCYKYNVSLSLSLSLSLS